MNKYTVEVLQIGEFVLPEGVPRWAKIEHPKDPTQPLKYHWYFNSYERTMEVGKLLKEFGYRVLMTVQANLYGGPCRGQRGESPVDVENGQDELCCKCYKQGQIAVYKLGPDFQYHWLANVKANDTEELIEQLNKLYQGKSV